MRTVIAQRRQTLWDIAVQYCGSTSSAFDIATLNGKAPTYQPRPGDSLIVPEPENKNVAAHYANHGIVPATSSQTK